MVLSQRRKLRGFIELLMSNYSSPSIFPSANNTNFGHPILLCVGKQNN